MVKIINMYELYVDGNGKGKYHNPMIHIYDPQSKFKLKYSISCINHGAIIELNAILEGIKYLKKREIRKARIYSDAFGLIYILQNKKGFKKKNLQSIYNKIIFEIENMTIFFDWIPCNKNKADQHKKWKKKKKENKDE